MRKNALNHVMDLAGRYRPSAAAEPAKDPEPKPAKKKAARRRREKAADE